MKRTSDLNKRHGMKEFGSVHGATQEVRINRLENRLTPQVPFPHRHDFYHLMLVTQGRGWHEIDFRKYPVRPGQIFVMKPGQVHSWKLSADTAGFVIEFGELSESASAAARSGADRFDLSKKSKAWLSLLRITEQMLEEYEGRLMGFEESLRHYLVPFFVELSRLTPEAHAARTEQDPTLGRFLELIEQNYRKEHRVSFYSEKMRITPKALTMRAMRGLGKSARAMIQERSLLECKRLLAYSDLTSAEIGATLGFEDPNYFSRFFKRMTGSTPMAFRKACRR
jgi:AraC family transcriptional activator of pobA